MRQKLGNGGCGRHYLGSQKRPRHGRAQHGEQQRGNEWKSQPYIALPQPDQQGTGGPADQGKVFGCEVTRNHQKHLYGDTGVVIQPSHRIGECARRCLRQGPVSRKVVQHNALGGNDFQYVDQAERRACGQAGNSHHIKQKRPRRPFYASVNKGMSLEVASASSCLRVLPATKVAITDCP